MVVTYTCTHPDCGVTSESASRAPKGKAVECPTCGRSFAPAVWPATDDIKCARGQAIGLLVMPTNLLTGMGLNLGALGIVWFVWAIWPLMFAAAPPAPAVVVDALIGMALGLLIFGWGAAICYGASRMQALSSYWWAMVGSILAIPVLVGIYCVIVLQDPKVIERFNADSA